jgi:hypothetical protein
MARDLMKGLQRGRALPYMRANALQLGQELMASCSYCASSRMSWPRVSNKQPMVGSLPLHSAAEIADAFAFGVWQRLVPSERPAAGRPVMSRLLT